MPQTDIITEVPRYNKPIKAEDLTLRQQVAQLVMVRIEGHFYSADNSYLKDVEQWITKDQVGGLVVIGGSVDGTFANLQRFQRLAPVPLLVVASFDEGVGQYIEGVTRFPSNMAIAATYSEENAYQKGRVAALEARALGISAILAPVMDISHSPAGPITNLWTYSDDPILQSYMGTSFIRGIQEQGVIACARPYSDRAAIAIESDSLSLVPGRRESLERMRLLPLEAAIEAGVGMIMAGNLTVAGSESSLAPVTQGLTITEDLLRVEYGFDGLIVIDGTNINTTNGGQGVGEAAVKALENGNEIILLPLQVNQTISAIVRAVETGRLSRERITSSVERVLRIKADQGLYEERLRMSREDLPIMMGLEEFEAAARKTARESITLVKDDLGLIPFRPNRDETLTHILISTDRDLEQFTRSFYRDVESTYGSARCKTFIIDEELSDSSISEMILEAGTTSRTLVTAFMPVYGDNDVSIVDSTHQKLLKELSNAGIQFVVVSFGNPYFPSLEAISTYLCGYSYGEVTMQAMADALFGRETITGQLPININAEYVRGSGLREKALSNGFNGELLGIEPPAYDFSLVYAVLDSAIRDQITPSAQVFIAQGESILADTAFGHYVYPDGIYAARIEDQPVTTSSLYDLASTTKVLVGSTLAMRLIESDYIALDDPVWHYLPSFRGEWKDNITIYHLLTHTSGLPGYREFWKEGIPPEDVLGLVIETELDFEPGTAYQYSDLGMLLFGAIVEQETGRELKDLAQDWVFSPLHLENARYNPPPEWRERIVPTEVDAEGRLGVIQGEVHDGTTWLLGGVSIQAGVFAPASELATLGKLYLDGGIIYGRRLFQEQTIDAFMNPQMFPDGRPIGRTLCWQVADSTEHSGDLFSSSAIGHSGYTGTSIWIDPELESVVVLFTNRVHPTRELAEQFKGIRNRFHNEVAIALGVPRPEPEAADSSGTALMRLGQDSD